MHLEWSMVDLGSNWIKLNIWKVWSIGRSMLKLNDNYMSNLTAYTNLILSLKYYKSYMSKLNKLVVGSSFIT